MPRRTRNSMDAALNSPEVATQSHSPFVLPQDRQAFINEIADAVIARSSRQQTPVAAESVNTSAQLREEQGMWAIPSLPSFINSFTMPSTSVNTVPMAAAMTTNASSYPVTTPVASFSSSPTDCQPFIVGPGCSPVSAKLVSQIIAGKFTELADLVSTNTNSIDEEPRLFLDGRMVITSSTRRQRPKLDDIVLWLEAFSIYVMVLTAHEINRWKDLCQYKLLIIRTQRQFSGKAWYFYDRAFREYAAACQLQDWSEINSQLFSFHTAGAIPRRMLTGPLHREESSGTPNSPTICYSWNSGSCSSRSSCRYAHKCLLCNGLHRKIECTQQPIHNTTSTRKRPPQEPLVYPGGDRSGVHNG